MICTEVIRKLNFERSKRSKLKESKLIKEVKKVKVERVQINKRGRKGQNHILVFSPKGTDKQFIHRYPSFQRISSLIYIEPTTTSEYSGLRDYIGTLQL